MSRSRPTTESLLEVITRMAAPLTSAALAALGVLALVAGPSSIEAEEIMCLETGPPPPSQTIDAIGTQKALFIFARFSDGMDIGPNGNTNPECADCGPDSGWPASQSAVLPSWHDTFLEDLDLNANPPEEPSEPGSLTDFFWKMSGGEHKLIGTTVDSVFTADETIETYCTDATYSFNPIGWATLHILQQVDNEVDFSEYNVAGNDNYVDYIFVYWNSMRTKVVDGSTTTIYTISPGNGAVSALVIYGTTVEMDNTLIGPTSGSTIGSLRANIAPNNPRFIRHRWMVAAVAAHEYGHDLLGLVDYPYSHLETMGPYSLMTGSMTPPVMMMSGWLRRELEWIDPPVLDFPTSFPLDTHA